MYGRGDSKDSTAKFFHLFTVNPKVKITAAVAAAAAASATAASMFVKRFYYGRFQQHEAKKKQKPMRA